MPITFRPARGDVLLCEFGPNPRDPVTYPVLAPPLAVPPEMYKRRHVIVINTNAPNELVLVAPLSTQTPSPVRAYHHLIPAGRYAFIARDSWLKGDMLMAVSRARLDRLKVDGASARTPLSWTDRRACQAAMLNALGLGRLTRHL